MVVSINKLYPLAGAPGELLVRLVPGISTLLIVGPVAECNVSPLLGPQTAQTNGLFNPISNFVEYTEEPPQDILRLK